MSECRNRWMLRLLETTDRGIDTSWVCKCHCLCLWFLSVAQIHSGFGMIAQASGLGMGVGRFTRLLRGVGLLAMPDAGQGTTWRVESICEVPLGAGVLRLFVPGTAVGVIITCRCVADLVISATRELFSEAEGVEFWPWTERLRNSLHDRNSSCQPVRKQVP